VLYGQAHDCELSILWRYEVMTEVTATELQSGTGSVIDQVLLGLECDEQD
jgi:hypothetical protein